MKKTGTILAILLIAVSTMFGQRLSEDFTVTNSTPYKVIDAGSKEYISLDNGFAIMAKMGKGIVYIQKFDINEMKEVARNTYDDMPDKAFFQDIIKLEDRIYYIYEAYNKKEKNFKVYSREINTDDATFEDQVELFTTSRKVVKNNKINLLGISSFGFGSAGHKFKVHKSFDNSKVMITYRSYPLDKSDARNYDDIGFFVFNNKMEKIWGSEVKMPYTEAQINNVAYSISSTGKAIMLVTNRETEKYEVISVNETGDLKVTELDVSTEAMVREMLIKEDANGNFLCAGYYANGIEFKMNVFTGGSFVFNVNGILYIQLNKEGELIESKKFDFSEDFIKQNLSKKQKDAVAKREKKGKAGILDLFLLDFSVKENGDAFFIGETQYVKKEFFQGPQQKMVYHYSNIVVTKVNGNGELQWMKKLAKNQAGLKGTGQMSYSYMEGKDADYIAFVDNPKNIDLSAEDGVPAAHIDGKGGYLTTYKIDHNSGDLEKHTICDLNKLGKYKAYQFKAYRILDAGNGNFLMEVYIKGKKDMMVKFKLN